MSAATVCHSQSITPDYRHKVELAITTLNDAINQIEQFRDDATDRPESQYLFFENKLGPYHTLVKLLKDQGKYFEALLYAERAKGRLLLEAVRRNTADLKNVLTPAEKVEIEQLHNKVLAIRERIQSANSDEPIGELKNQLDVAKREFASFEKTLVAAHRELLLRAGPPQPLTNANLNRLVSVDDLAYLEYVVTRDNIGLFILRQNGVTQKLKYVKLSVNTDELRGR